MTTRDDAFSLGESDGHSAGIAGNRAPPKPNPALLYADPAGMADYRTGAEIGFEKGRQQREELQALSLIHISEPTRR